MRVLHVVGDSAYGGGSKIILRIAAAAHERGHEVSVLATNRTLVDEARDLGLRPVELDCIWRPIRPLRDLRGLRDLQLYLQQEKYDLVHTHTSKAGFVGRRAAFAAGVAAIVHTVHGFAFHEGSPRVTILAYALLERLAAGWCHKVVTVSEFHRRWAIDLGIGKSDKFLAICNGIGDAPLLAAGERQEIRSELGVCDGAVLVISAGRLAQGKGLENLIDAMVQVRAKTDQNVVLLLPGSGPLADQLRSQIDERGLATSVILPGYRSDVRRLVAASDIVALPSIREGLSIALLEGMSAGKAIVASDIGSNREATRNGRAASLVRAGSRIELEDAMLKLIASPPMREALAREALTVFNESYREEAMVTAYCDLYRRLGVDCRSSGREI